MSTLTKHVRKVASSRAARKKVSRHAARGTLVFDMVVLEHPEPITPRPPATRITNARLKALGKKHKPPQSWYDRDEELS